MIRKAIRRRMIGVGDVLFLNVSNPRATPLRARTGRHGAAARSAIADTRIRRAGEEAERPGGCKSRLLPICHGKCQSKVL